MKANPGGTITGDAIIGREAELAEIWRKIEKRSVILNAERRVGKTCILRKMQENPQHDWIPLLCWVEDARHPIDFVEKIYAEAEQMEAQSKKGCWLRRVRKAYKKIAETEVQGWKLPSIQSNWKQLLNDLMQDIATNTGNRILVMLDEFPMMVANIIDTPKHGEGANVAMEFLDALRAIRQKYEPSNQIRFLFSGSIGLHLILEDLKTNHGYKGNPTNNMALKVLSGMCREDVQRMCQKYLDEEAIQRREPSEFEEQMFELTDGLPLYVQYVCERFQDDKRSEVSPDDIHRTLRQMMDSHEVEWFSDAAKRIDSYYPRLGQNRIASHVLNMLSREQNLISERKITDYVRSQMTMEDDNLILGSLELLLKDNYIVRDTSTGARRYCFRYGLMRWWWEINRG